ncbi:RHS repeat-associated core domain-containing protein, partial [Lysinibacillus fusiformis]|uniref:RHS repeat-associated core domain-containing protein n=3 Tax=Bacillati TaxID=1783272 RepID=UPI0038000468
TNDSLKTAAGAAIASLAYGYYPSGRLKTKTTSGLTGSTTQSYTYDQAGRLNSWNDGAASTAYAYDGNGNLTADGTNTATYNQRNQLTSQNTTATYTYSPRGTRTSSTSGSNTSTATYDAFDQLTAQAGKTYTYDALGRLAQTAGHSFTYDATSSALTSDGTEKYTRTPGGSLTTIGANGAAAFAYTDRHGDLVGSFTATASITSGSSAYDPWGKPTATSGTTHSIGYQGGWTDSATGQISTASRWYDPASAGFTSRDTANLEPVTSSIANRYSYGAADPLNNTDPTGHNPNPCEPDGATPNSDAPTPPRAPMSHRTDIDNGPYYDPGLWNTFSYMQGSAGQHVNGEWAYWNRVSDYISKQRWDAFKGTIAGVPAYSVPGIGGPAGGIPAPAG